MRVVWAILVSAVLLVGCQSRPSAAPVVVVKKPLIDLSLGEVGFPLDQTSMPAGPSGLKSALDKAYSIRLDETIQKPLIAVEGTRLSRLSKLQIDLSNCAVKPDYEPKMGKKTTTFKTLCQADYFEYRAQPLRYQKHETSIAVLARDATLVLAPASEADKQLICLSDLSTGTLIYSSRMADLRQSMMAGAKLRSANFSFSLNAVDLRLLSRDLHDLEITLRIDARVLLVPATVEVTGHISIDGDKNVVVTGFNAHGLDPSGVLLAGLMQPAMDKMNNRAAPLVKFPGDRIKVTDIRIFTGDEFRLEVDLARR